MRIEPESELECGRSAKLKGEGEKCKVQKVLPAILLNEPVPANDLGLETCVSFPLSSQASGTTPSEHLGNGDASGQWCFSYKMVPTGLVYGR